MLNAKRSSAEAESTVKPSAIFKPVSAIITCAVLAFGSVACSDAVVDKRNEAGIFANGSENSDAMNMPHGTNAVSQMILPDELLASESDSNSDPISLTAENPSHVGKTSPVIPMPPKISISMICARPSNHDRENRHVASGVQLIAELREVISATESKVIAELKQGLRCREMALSLQNLPKDKKLVLNLRVGHPYVAFSGSTGEFTYNGIDTLRLALKLKREPKKEDPDAIIGVTFEGEKETRVRRR